MVKTAGTILRSEGFETGPAGAATEAGAVLFVEERQHQAQALEYGDVSLRSGKKTTHLHSNGRPWWDLDGSGFQILLVATQSEQPAAVLTDDGGGGGGGRRLITGNLNSCLMNTGTSFSGGVFP